MRSTTYEFDAIGTRWWCEILDETHEFTASITEQILAVCDEFDKRYSRFRDDSLVMELFRTGRLSNPPHEMVKMFAFAHEMYDVTEGVYDIGVGATLHSLGYGQRVHGAVAPDNIWDLIAYADTEIIAPKGIMIDFGGQGKGWLIDRLVELLRSVGIEEFIINGGGDMYVASTTPISIALEDPRTLGTKYGQTLLRNRALAGSSTFKRSWSLDDKQHHHIIDPSRHASADNGVVGTFVKAKTATVADSIATVLIVRPELAEKMKSLFGVDVILVR